MKHVVHPRDRASRERRIREVTLEKLDVVEVIEIAALAGDEIVSDADAMVPSHQLLREMGSDEPGAACHKVGSHSIEASPQRPFQRVPHHVLIKARDIGVVIGGGDV